MVHHARVVLVHCSRKISFRISLGNLPIIALTLVTFWKCRLQFVHLITLLLTLVHSTYATAYWPSSRLDMMITLPLDVFKLQHLTCILRRPPCSLDFVHFNFFHVDLVPSAVIWRSDPAFKFQRQCRTDEMVIPYFCFLSYFALFGFAGEAQKQYKTLFHRFLKSLGLKYGISKPSKPAYLSRFVFSLFPARDVVNGCLVTTGLAKLTVWKVQSEPCTPIHPASGFWKSIIFSVTSSDDATVRIDLDIEKPFGLGSPEST